MVKHTKKPYFLLDEPVALDDGNNTLDRLLGLAVADPCNPTAVAYSPDKPLRAQDAIDDLYPMAPVVCEDFKLVREKTSQQKASAKLYQLVKLSLGHGNSHKEDFSAAVFRRFSMDNAKRRLETLLREVPKHSPGSDATGSEATHGADHEAHRKQQQLETRAKYRNEVLGFLNEQEEGTLYIISGFITCIDLKKNLGRSKKTSAELGAGTGPTGPFSVVDTQVGAEYLHAKDFGVQGAYVGEYLIACSYYPLYAKSKESGKSNSNTTSFLGRLLPKFGKERNYAIGSEELWYFGDRPAKGNTEPLLGKKDRSPTSTVEATSDDGGMAFELLYPESDDESNDGSAENEEEED